MSNSTSLEKLEIRKNILILGGVSYDTVAHVEQFPTPTAGNVYTSACYDMVGSTSTGKALSLAALGHHILCSAQIGADTFGQKIKKCFENAEINFLPIADPAGTERHFNLMDADGERMSIYQNYRTFEPELPLDELNKAIDKNEILVFDIMNFTRNFIPKAQSQNKAVWCDIHDYDGEATYHQDFIEGASFLFMSNDKMSDPQPFMAAQIEKGKRVVACTLGSKGALIFDQAGNKIEVPCLSDITLVDSNGAGDAFFSGFLDAHCQGHNTQRSAEQATILAGLTVTKNEIYFKDASQALLKKLWQEHYGK